MNKPNRILSLVLAVAAVAFAGSARAARREPVRPNVLIIPARYVVVQVAFDVAAFQPLVLVSYQAERDMNNPLLHVWHEGKWAYINASDYAQGAFIRPSPGRTVIVGTDMDVPPLVLQAESWSESVERVKTIDTAELINGLGRVLRLRSRQIKWLAKRYKLTVIQGHLRGERAGRYVMQPTAPTTIVLETGESIPAPLKEPIAPIP